MKNSLIIKGRLSALCALLWLVTTSVSANTPQQAARQQALDAFRSSAGVFIEVAPDVINRPWRKVPFDQQPYTYTFDEIRTLWPVFMRGLRLPYPSAEYLESRYTRFPELMHALAYQDADWHQHHLNTLEVWQRFFRGDLEQAYRLSLKYRGFALIPGVFAQMIYAVYLAPSYEEKQMHLQSAVNRIREMAEQMVILPSDQAYRQDYVMLRLGYMYGLGRLVEDEPIAKVAAMGVPALVLDVASEALAADPEHASLLALDAAVDANMIRRGGKVLSRVNFGAATSNAMNRFQTAMELVPDMTVIRYEYANALLYTESAVSEGQAEAQLVRAASEKAQFSMEALDALYAAKRLDEVRSLKASGMGFARFDRLRRKHMKKTNENPYSVLVPPFTVH